jgi:uncharacterized protein YycO
MTGKTMFDGYRHLRKGDIVLSKDYMKLNNLVTSPFSHCGICVSLDRSAEIVQATHDGVSAVTFADFCFHANRVVILRPNVSEEYKNKMIKCALGEIGKKFDIYFTLGADARYCAELVDACDISNKLGIPMGNFMGWKYVTPGQIYEASSVEVVWDSAKL